MISGLRESPFPLPMVEKPISLRLPENYEWLDVKVISSSQGVEATITLPDKRQAILDTGLFRAGEFVQIEALATISLENVAGLTKQINQERLLLDALSFTHRVAELSEIKTFEPSEEYLIPIDNNEIQSYISAYQGLHDWINKQIDEKMPGFEFVSVEMAVVAQYDKRFLSPLVIKVRPKNSSHDQNNSRNMRGRKKK